jgi:hypothetical protein
MTIKQTFLLVAMGSFLMFACRKPPAPPSVPAGTPEAPVVQAGAGASGVSQPEGAQSGYVLRVSTGFYTIDPDTRSDNDAAKYNATLTLGEKFAVISEPRKAVYQNREYEFIKIRRDTNAEGYVISSTVSNGGKLGVIIDDNARIYRSPKNVDVTNSMLSKKTVFVFFPETERDGFVEFKAYDPGKETTFTSSYLKLPVISTRDSDIQSSVLLQVAKSLNAAKEQNRIQGLLESAIESYPDSIFIEEIQEMLNPAVPDIPIQLAAVSRMTVSSDNVNVRDRPDTAAGIVAQLDTGTAVTVSEETVDLYTVDGNSGKWYHITEPLKGWVFGAWLSQ